MQANERTLMSMGPARAHFLRYYVGIVLLLGLTVLLWLFKSFLPALVQTFTLPVTLFIAVFILLLLLIAEWKRASTRYVVTDFRIIKKHGILRRNETVVPYRQLERVVLHQGIIDRILGIGSLTIDTGDDTVEIASVRDPKGVEKAIMGGMQTLQASAGSR